MLFDEHKGMKKMLSPTMNPTSVTFRFCAPNYARKIKTTSKKNTTVTRMNQKRKKEWRR